MNGINAGQTAQPSIPPQEISGLGSAIKEMQGELLKQGPDTDDNHRSKKKADDRLK